MTDFWTWLGLLLVYGGAFAWWTLALWEFRRGRVPRSCRLGNHTPYPWGFSTRIFASSGALKVWVACSRCGMRCETTVSDFLPEKNGQS